MTVYPANVYPSPCEHQRLPEEPTAYVSWHTWARKKGGTHRQEQCPKCGLWCIWVPKVKRRKAK